MRFFSFSAVLVLIGLGCSGPISRPAPDTGGEPAYTPIMAIDAAASKPMGLRATFVMQVKNTSYGQGRSKDYLFLNSEEDYRDRRCLTVRIAPAAIREYLKKGIDPSRAFNHKTIRIQGIAQQLKIFFISDSGIQSDKYYYQTQIAVLSPDQITLASE